MIPITVPYFEALETRKISDVKEFIVNQIQKANFSEGPVDIYEIKRSQRHLLTAMNGQPASYMTFKTRT